MIISSCSAVWQCFILILSSVLKPEHISEDDDMRKINMKLKMIPANTILNSNVFLSGWLYQLLIKLEAALLLCMVLSSSIFFSISLLFFSI